MSVINMEFTLVLKDLQYLAKQGDAKAQNNLGVAYCHGEGVSQNHNTAFKWFQHAAK